MMLQTDRVQRKKSSSQACWWTTFDLFSFFSILTYFHYLFQLIVSYFTSFSCWHRLQTEGNSKLQSLFGKICICTWMPSERGIWRMLVCSTMYQGTILNFKLKVHQVLRWKSRLFLYIRLVGLKAGCMRKAVVLCVMHTWPGLDSH